MYGSAGAFLSPENLVGRSGMKFPPEAATLSGLFFNASRENSAVREILKQKLFVAGPFWAECKDPERFYVPIPWSRIISEKGTDEWTIENKGEEKVWHREHHKLEPDFSWQPIDSWRNPLKVIKAKSSPWKYVSVLHPRMKKDERHTLAEDGLFLEHAVQMPEETCLIYLSSHELPEGWYRFGGENHLVEIDCKEIKSPLTLELLQQPIQKAFALITPAVWGSNRLSYRYPQHPESPDRYPQHPDFPKVSQMLTDKPLPYRYRAARNLGRGRYAVPAGSVYVLDQPLNKPWWCWKEEWFPKERL